MTEQTKSGSEEGKGSASNDDKVQYFLIRGGVIVRALLLLVSFSILHF